MIEIGYYSILISLFLSAYSGLALIVGIKNRRAELVASAENAAAAVFIFLTVSATAMVYALVTRNFKI
jgi:cytochrome c biogenesis factor